MKATVIAALFAMSSTDQGSPSVNAQVMFPMPSKWNDKLNEQLEPVFDAMEPFKQGFINHERGVPFIHEPLDCKINVEDPQCKNETMASSPMVGAGHHVRAETNVPIIGVLTQPIPGGHNAWNAEFERAQQESGRN